MVCRYHNILNISPRFQNCAREIEKLEFELNDAPPYNKKREGEIDIEKHISTPIYKKIPYPMEHILMTNRSESTRRH